MINVEPGDQRYFWALGADNWVPRAPGVAAFARCCSIAMHYLALMLPLRKDRCPASGSITHSRSSRGYRYDLADTEREFDQVALPLPEGFVNVHAPRTLLAVSRTVGDGRRLTVTAMRRRTHPHHSGT